MIESRPYNRKGAGHVRSARVTSASTGFLVAQHLWSLTKTPRSFRRSRIHSNVHTLTSGYFHSYQCHDAIRNNIKGVLSLRATYEMDPISTIGAVASIVQLASAAVSLSKSLYIVGSAISSAPEDIKSLAEDLEDFAGSLNIFSRLLEDSESFYSDDIYLCAAKIMRDASNLYVKVQRLVGKLGKGGWKARVRWGFREGEVRKLMGRLRDIKGSLVHITVSLHLDLELSRL